MAGYVMFRRRVVPVADKRPGVRRMRDVMSRAILTITGELSLGDALAVMIGAGTRHLVVVNGERAARACCPTAMWPRRSRGTLRP